MKRFFGYCCVLVLAVGCSNFNPEGGFQAQGGGSKDQIVLEQRIGAASQSRRLSAEEMASAPPQRNERVAEHYEIAMGDRQVEIEGVCQLSEDGLTCWKPNGEKHDALATEFTNFLKSREDNYSNNFQFKFNKKNRILIMKSTVKAFVPGKSSPGLGYGLMYENNSGAKEGWNSSGNYWQMSPNNDPKADRVERQVLVGSFDRDTKAFPLRYQFTESKPDRTKVPFVKGEFSVGGNNYEITEISDKPAPNQGGYFGGYPSGPGSKPPVYTYIKIKVVKVTEPNNLLYLFPANDKGEEYGGFNDKGEPIGHLEFQKLMIERQRKMIEDMKKAGGSGRNPFPGNFIQPMNLDPSANYANGIFTGAINVPMSKIKKLSIALNERTVFVFDKIQLDPKTP